MAENDAAKKKDKSADGVKPKCISSATWERFQALKKKTDAITQRSTKKRTENLQKKILQNVEEKFTSEEDRALLKEHGVSLGQPMVEGKHSSKGVSLETSTLQDKTSPESTEKFEEVQKYLGINDHLKEGVSLSGAPSSGLEKQVHDAIASGNIEKAEKLSDKLAAREYGVKISEAIAARDYSKRKKEEEETAKMKKKKKLNWGFEHKQRWETKSNM